MKVLLIGGTGVISQSISELLTVMGQEVYVLNRGTRELPGGVKQLIGDCNDIDSVKNAVKGYS
ncbi:MAG: NAD-dependent dehydratase, partial [Oscillospiraceae bacterium]|nr:NAD-dependent dehydratase [Oscillospiraceae bacterium]